MSCLFPVVAWRCPTSDFCFHNASCWLGVVSAVQQHACDVYRCARLDGCASLLVLCHQLLCFDLLLKLWGNGNQVRNGSVVSLACFWVFRFKLEISCVDLSGVDL